MELDRKLQAFKKASSLIGLRIQALHTHTHVTFTHKNTHDTHTHTHRGKLLRREYLRDGNLIEIYMGDLWQQETKSEKMTGSRRLNRKKNDRQKTESEKE